MGLSVYDKNSKGRGGDKMNWKNGEPVTEKFNCTSCDLEVELWIGSVCFEKQLCAFCYDELKICGEIL